MEYSLKTEERRIDRVTGLQCKEDANGLAYNDTTTASAFDTESVTATTAASSDPWTAMSETGDILTASPMAEEKRWTGSGHLDAGGDEIADIIRTYVPDDEDLTMDASQADDDKRRQDIDNDNNTDVKNSSRTGDDDNAAPMNDTVSMPAGVGTTRSSLCVTVCPRA